VSRRALRKFVRLLESDSKLEIPTRVSLGSSNENPDKVKANKEDSDEDEHEK
jgi:hypothetical protein